MIARATRPTPTAGGRASGAEFRAAVAVAAGLFVSASACALYGGYEEDPRTFSIGKEYFLDELSFQPLPPMLEEWYAAELRPGGAQGWRLGFGSLNIYEGWVGQELGLEYPFTPSWAWSFRYEQGDTPGGRYGRAWAGLEWQPAPGWSLGAAATPDGDKETIDLGFALGRETVAGERVRLRWEARAIFPDNWYNMKNDDNASFRGRPLDLQLSLVGSWGAGSWVSLELDRDLPFEKTYGENPEAAPEDQNYVFSFENFEARMRGSFKPNAGGALLTRLVVMSSDRSRVALAPGDPAEDYASDYDLWIAGLEWWRRLDGSNEVGLGYEYVDFDECTRRPNDPVEPSTAMDRTDHIIYVRYRRRLRERVWLTTGLWNDFLERVTWRFDGGVGTTARSEAKLTLSLESSRESQGQGSARLVLGWYLELDNWIGGGGYVQFTAIF